VHLGYDTLIKKESHGPAVGILSVHEAARNERCQTEKFFLQQFGCHEQEWNTSCFSLINLSIYQMCNLN
jgi:hypothetical protein